MVETSKTFMPVPYPHSVAPWWPCRAMEEVPTTGESSNVRLFGIVVGLFWFTACFVQPPRAIETLIRSVRSSAAFHRKAVEKSGSGTQLSVQCSYSLWGKELFFEKPPYSKCCRPRGSQREDDASLDPYPASILTIMMISCCS